MKEEEEKEKIEGLWMHKPDLCDPIDPRDPCPLDYGSSLVGKKIAFDTLPLINTQLEVELKLALDDIQVFSIEMENKLMSNQQESHSRPEEQKKRTKKSRTKPTKNQADDNAEPRPSKKVRTGSKATRRKKPAAKRRRRLVDDEAENDDSDLDDTRSVDEESIGSLADFIVEDETEIEKEIQESKKKEKIVEAVDPLDGIDPSNIVTGKRQRKKPERYQDENYWALMTQDMNKAEVEEFEKEVQLEDATEAIHGKGGDTPEDDDDYHYEEEVTTDTTTATSPLEDEEDEEDEEEEDEEEEEDNANDEDYAEE